jgi:amidophosphoribosyltransferase
MAGLTALSVNQKIYGGNFTQELFWATFYLQHSGEEYGGLSVFNPDNQNRITTRTHGGLFRPTFKDDLRGMEGTEGTGYCGSAREPFFTRTKFGKMSLSISGNFLQRPILEEGFMAEGHNFERSDDVELVSKLLVRKGSIVEGIKGLAGESAAYALMVLTEEGIYAGCSPSGHWPLVLGAKEGAVTVASESGGFQNLGFRLIRSLDPGEVILLKNGSWRTVVDSEEFENKKIQFCSFVWVYTGFANTVFQNIAASEVRKKLGASLAARDIKNGFIPDVVIPIPDSGRFHAIGYQQEFCRQGIKPMPIYDEALLKYPYAGRSYTPQSEKARKLEANIKILVSGENCFEGKQIVVCDDSLVRGVQARANLVPKLKSLDPAGIHFRISNPELKSHCPWGKTTKKDETLVKSFPLKSDRIKSLGIESLEYNSIDDLVKAIGLPREELCVDCDLEEK